MSEKKIGAKTFLFTLVHDIECDLKKMEVKGWKKKMKDRERWRLVVEEAKVQPGL
jgi:hypothetical protein